MATGNQTSTAGAAGVQNEQELALQGLFKSIAQIDPNSPEAAVEMMRLFEGYYKQTGNMQLAENVNQVLKKAQEGKLDLRKAFGDFTLEIWKLARTTEQKLQEKDQSQYLDAYYGTQQQRLSAELDVQTMVIKGAAGGYKLLAMIGSILSAIPGLEQIGKDLVQSSIQASKELKVDKIEEDAIRQSDRENAKKPKIGEVTAEDAGKKADAIIAQIMNDAKIVGESRGSQRASGGTNPDAPQQTPFSANGATATTPAAASGTPAPTPTPTPAPAADKPAICNTSFGSKMPECQPS